MSNRTPTAEDQASIDWLRWLASELANRFDAERAEKCAQRLADALAELERLRAVLESDNPTREAYTIGRGHGAELATIDRDRLRQRAEAAERENAEARINAKMMADQLAEAQQREAALRRLFEDAKVGMDLFLKAQAAVDRVAQHCRKYPGSQTLCEVLDLLLGLDDAQKEKS